MPVLVSEEILWYTVKKGNALFPESATVMEFHEKLQKLRKQSGLTQEELAQALFVSRTAVSKWESGRGYPNIESLKDLAAFFSVTVDELLSGEEVLDAAREDLRQQRKNFRVWAFALLDIGTAILFVLPLFAQTVSGEIQPVSLLQLNEVAAYMRLFYAAMTGALVLWGILSVIGKERVREEWLVTGSMILHGLTAFLFIAGAQTYAAAFLFVLLVIKALLLIKKR